VSRCLTRSRLLLAVLAVLIAAAAIAGGVALTPLPAAVAQAPPPYRLLNVGDISPPTNETSGNDHGTAELALKLNPDGMCLNGDVQYETGSEAMFRALTGFDGSYGRLVKDRIICMGQGNHDAADGGNDGLAPGFTSYFADNFARLRANAAAGVFPAMGCETETPACQPAKGYYRVDLDADRNGQPDWAVVVFNSNCQRAGGGTGDTGTPSCASASPMLDWLRATGSRLNTGATGDPQTSGRKCTLVVDHHERWGTSFFNSDAALDAPWQVGNHFHWDVWLSGHSHSVGRTGPLTWNGVLASSGQRQITSGAGGRSLTPHRINPAPSYVRYRDNTKFGVNLLELTVSQHPAGYQVGTWRSRFFFTDGTVGDDVPTQAGCWP
jgi:hypothetical protein